MALYATKNFASLLCLYVSNGRRKGAVVPSPLNLPLHAL